MYVRDIVLSTRLAYESAWASDSRERQKKLLEFGHCTYCVVDLFVRTMGNRFATKSTKKIIVNLDDDIDEPDETSIRDWIPYLEFRWPINLASFDCGQSAEKKQYVLAILRDALLWIASVKTWETEAIHAVYSELMDKRICHHGYWKKGKSFASPDKTTRGFRGVYYECELDRLRIYCVFFQGRNVEIGRQIVIDEPALDAPLMCYWKDIKWISNSSLVLRTKDGRLVKCNMKDLSRIGG